jgi:hypothetical protein
MSIEVEYVDPEELWREALEWHERAVREDEEALRSGRMTPAELQRKNQWFDASPERARINLDSARRLS